MTRRTFALALLPFLTLVACGGSGDEAEDDDLTPMAVHVCGIIERSDPRDEQGGRDMAWGELPSASNDFADPGDAEIVEEAHGYADLVARGLGEQAAAVRQVLLDGYC